MSYRHWMLAVAFGLAVTGAALGQESASTQEQPAQNEVAPSATEQKADNETTIEPDSVAAEVAPANPPGENHNQQATADHTDNSQDSLSSGDGMIFWWGDTPAQWVMAITGFGALIISGWAVLLLRATLFATREAVREAGDATKAAQVAVDVTEQAAKQQLRAYLLPDKITFLQHPTNNLYLAVEIKNTGQTPAKAVRGKVKCASVPAREVATFPFLVDEGLLMGSLGASQVYSGTFLQPNGNRFLDEFPMIESGDIVFFVWGRVTYQDQFDDPHTTNFRYRYAPYSDEFVHCDGGNDAD